MKRILIIDNYDSFVYNLVHMLQTGGYELSVVRNDKITVADAAGYDKILLSPGPGIPSEAGIMPDLIKAYAGSVPIFGVCLGHQAIAEAFGGRLENMATVHHGLSEPITLADKDDYLFTGLPNRFNVGRYHSWRVCEPLPKDLVVTASDDEGTVMALRHRTLDVRGVQFHPESVLTEHGGRMLANWLTR